MLLIRSSECVKSFKQSDEQQWTCVWASYVDARVYTHSIVLKRKGHMYIHTLSDITSIIPHLLSIFIVATCTYMYIQVLPFVHGFRKCLHAYTQWIKDYCSVHVPTCTHMCRHVPTCTDMYAHAPNAPVVCLYKSIIYYTAIVQFLLIRVGWVQGLETEYGLAEP